MKLSTTDRIKIMHCMTSRIAYLDDMISNLSNEASYPFRRDRDEIMTLLARMDEHSWLFEQEDTEE